MNANPERDVRDMDRLMEIMSDALTKMEDIVSSDICGPISDVLDEWSCTKECIQELTDELEPLLD